MSCLMFCGARHKLEDLRLVFSSSLRAIFGFWVAFCEPVLFALQSSVDLLSLQVVSRSNLASNAYAQRLISTENIHAVSKL